MKSDFSNTYAMHMPLTQTILEEKITLSEEAACMAKQFLALSRDLSTQKLSLALKQLLQTYRETHVDKKHIALKPDISKLQQEHEHYFKIIRYTNQSGDLLVENALDSYLAFLTDYQLGSRLTPIDLGHIDSGLKSLLSYLLYPEGKTHV